MAQINLLKQANGAGNFGDKIPKILARVLFLFLALLAAYYIWLFLSFRNTENKIVQTRKKINSEKQAALNMPERGQLFTRQSQIKALEGLISQHVYWSQLLPKLAQVTLKTASYGALSSGADGTISMSVTVPTLADLDKYMQVFDLSQFNENFSDIRIGGFSKVQGKTSSFIQFQVKMKYNPAVINYQQPKEQAK